MTFPLNVALGPLSTLVTLEVLGLGGNAIDVAYVITLGNFATIPAALVWGMAADRFDRRKIVLLSYGATAASLVTFPFVNSIPALAALYGTITFVTVAPNTPFNLLVMETHEKPKWAAGFSKLSMLSSLGVLTGLLVSSVGVLYLRVPYIVQGLGAVVLGSTVAGFRLLPRPQVRLERVALVHHKESFLTRLKMFPLFFLHLPDPSHFKMFRLSRLRTKPINFVPLLYIAIFLFYLSSGLFNTVYPVSLYQRGLSKAEVLAVVTVGMTVQSLSFARTGWAVERLGEQKAASLSLILRGASYVGLAMVTMAAAGLPVLIAGVTLYPLAAGVAFAIYYASSNTLVFKVVGERSHGRGLGVYSTMTGSALFVGSLASGYLSHYVGFYADFGLAGALLWIAAYLFHYLEEG
ncbi:MFS transporter [Sulfodiicoccus acidiphilus]|uniref:MFS transporter n=2 Tax=Sulfodiicoccus acidiphilus TaxID=1670455 RepID=A0A348B1D1_9CREN|nr:MFS transporter [Sulfodiicoccus acidiphilus]GGT91917.1 MFS transporter [Sulfodiicoccus acidiphilus]